MSDESRLIFCKIRVTPEGVAIARYRWQGSSVEGGDVYDECVTGWKDDDVIDAIAPLAGIERRDYERVEVEWE